MHDASPFALALRRFWARPSARIGTFLLAACAALATYAPFLCSETAVLWRGPDGWSAPILADLFNRRCYPQRHDLLFNLLALILPLGLLAWRVLRVRLRWLVGGLVAVWLLCQVPCLPATGGWQAAWDDRPAPTRTVAAARADAAVWAVFPPVAHRYDRPYAGAVLAPPGSRDPELGERFWLGTDPIGHDLLARMLFGARISLTIGLVATGLSLAIGTLVGAAAGFFGGRIDLILSRIMEIMLCFPTFILVLVVVAMLDRSIFTIMGVIGLTGWAGTARLVRGAFLAESVKEYVLAGQVLGLGRRRLMFRHILPNALTPLLITATFGVAGAVFTESGLSFLSLGDPTVPSWGWLLNQGRENIAYAWLIWIPGLAVFLLISALNLMGNALREALDPKAH